MEKRKRSLWPWTIRAIAISLPFLYAVATRPNGFNAIQSPARGLAMLTVLAIVVSCWYRGHERTRG